ncbi:MAG: FHIPEP family type III secretion protein [Treponema sp.]|nr:FHIPEP family type III secretion protein [Treponema sp.]
MNQITLGIGCGLIPLVDPDKGAKLLDSISHLRKKIKEEHGVEVPKVHITDNSDLKSREYRIIVSGVFNGTISQELSEEDMQNEIVQNLEKSILKFLESYPHHHQSLPKTIACLAQSCHL